MESLLFLQFQSTSRAWSHCFTYAHHVAGLLRRGIADGEFQPDLDVASTADVVCQLQVGYSNRACRRDPMFPSAPEVVDAAVRLVLDALRARA